MFPKIPFPENAKTGKIFIETLVHFLPWKCLNSYSRKFISEKLIPAKVYTALHNFTKIYTTMFFVKDWSKVKNRNFLNNTLANKCDTYCFKVHTPPKNSSFSSWKCKQAGESLSGRLEIPQPEPLTPICISQFLSYYTKRSKMIALVVLHF